MPSVPVRAPRNGWRTFVVLWATQSLSVVGSALTYFAISIYLAQTLYARPEQKPELALALSVVALAGALPAVLGAPLAGAWADRHDRRRTMLGCDLGSSLVCLVLASLAMTGTLTLYALVPLVVLLSLLHSYHGASFDTSYVMLVPSAQLPRANGMMQTMWSLSGLLAPGLAAFILALPALLLQGGLVLPGWLTGGIALVFLLDTLTFLFSGLVLTRLQIPSPRRTETVRPRLWADVAFGFRYIWARKPLLWLLGTFSFINFVFAPMGIFEPLIVKFTLAPDWTARGLTFESALALLATVGGLGGVLGGVLVSMWGGLKRQRVLGILIPMLVAGLALIAFGLSRNLYLSAAIVALAFAMTPIMNAHSQAIWQTQVPPELQGRVFSVRRLIAQFTAPVATALAGIAGGIFNPGTVMVVLGVLFSLFCLAQLANPYLRRVEDKAWLEELASRQAKGAVSGAS
ncbi:MFS transporter [Deinococcus peraridilitoris]|uniref:Major Facilitator Superfamily transporter n=1 Tax=Deinococcus peraridilitoris (strain DSM 19664 / LMG 22246 / CIP 109416 / KR-200) TaxID=937777 RepID=K9ZY56_DEIPD|nr:MFS transporter [Deinococcus peraridilitoris]AFZ65867.1 Major Facilitator Superfamily transporter [Deinococcus peraridilitoris DSM 19664]